MASNQEARDKWWSEAMELFDNDEEFLHEISSDLKEEVQQCLSRVRESLTEPVSPDIFLEF
jgi:hypothetical protein